MILKQLVTTGTLLALLFVNQGVYAQVTAYYGAEKAFMDRCSPAGTTENVQKACGCLMKSITRNMTLQDFNSLEERAERGTLTSAEIEQKKQLIARSKPGLYECMGR